MSTPTPTPTPTIENVIVVMLENRSYDNMLGGLYLPTNPPPYNQPPSGQAYLNGLTGTEWNPNQNQKSGDNWYVTVANNAGETRVNGAGTYYPPTTIPVIDPGETFAEMAFQINGASQSSNPYTSSWSPMQPPATPPSAPPSTPSQMSGFTGDYMRDKLGSVTPIGNSINDVMNYFTPVQVPVTAWLANHFAVCDQWFASVPSQTFVNRAFSHCAAPSVASPNSLVDDVQYGLASNLLDLPSIFSQLDTAYPNSPGPNWKVYFHDYSISMLTVPYVMTKATSSPNQNVATYDNSDWGTAVPQPITQLGTRPTQSALALNAAGAVPSTFMEDLANEALPMYAVIEPRYSNGVVNAASPPLSLTPNSYPANSNHPGASNYPSPGTDPVGPTNPPIDVADGEAFLKQLYNALQQSSYWHKTLLIITYDEHGGLYDHVAPPLASPPGATTSSPPITIPEVGSVPLDPAARTFNFNVYGCRVPTIIVSPYIAAGSRIVPPPGPAHFDHTSIIKTVWECFFTYGSPTIPPSVASLTNRDAQAPGLYEFLDFTILNDPGQC